MRMTTPSPMAGASCSRTAMSQEQSAVLDRQGTGQLHKRRHRDVRERNGRTHRIDLMLNLQAHKARPRPRGPFFLGGGSRTNSTHRASAEKPIHGVPWL